MFTISQGIGLEEMCPLIKDVIIQGEGVMTKGVKTQKSQKMDDGFYERTEVKFFPRKIM